jgi:hypothetical protein
MGRKECEFYEEGLRLVSRTTSGKMDAIGAIIGLGTASGADHPA